MANNKPSQAKNNRQLLSNTAKELGISTKGFSKTLDRLRYQSEENVNKMVGLMKDEGYSLDMIDKLFSKDWEKESRKSGGKRGEFKTAHQKKVFENKFKREQLKQSEKAFKKKHGMKYTKEEKQEVMNKSFKEAKKQVEDNKVFNPTIRKKAWSAKTKNVKWEPGSNEFQEKVAYANRIMGCPLDSPNGFAVVYDMENRGVTMQKAMKEVIYDRLDAIPDRYQAPTMIPNGIVLSDSNMRAFRDLNNL
jgi:hypothetical protein